MSKELAKLGMTIGYVIVMVVIAKSMSCLLYEPYENMLVYAILGSVGNLFANDILGR